MFKYVKKAFPFSSVISVIGALLVGWEGMLDFSTTDFSGFDLGKVLPIFGIMFFATMLGGTFLLWYKDLNDQK